MSICSSSKREMPWLLAGACDGVVMGGEEGVSKWEWRRRMWELRSSELANVIPQRSHGKV